MTNDIFAFIGLASLCTGLTVRYGWDVACIIGGVILMTLAIIGALRK